MDYFDIQKRQEGLWTGYFEKYDYEVQALGSESEVHKYLRYSKIAKVFEEDKKFSVLDVGAGFGNFYDFLKKYCSNSDIQYMGSDVTEVFIKVGKAKNPDIDLRRMNILTEEVENFDYVIFSGLFHQNGSVKIEEWKDFMFSIIKRAFKISRKGIAFNVLSSFADYKKGGNFYPDTFELQKFLHNELSRFISIDQSYPLFETTFYVFSSEYIKERFPQQELAKYIK